MPSARFLAAVLEPNSAECAVHLITITHEAFGEPLRWCEGGADIVSNAFGEEPVTFKAIAMQVAPPGDSADAGGRRGRLTVDNTGLDIIGTLRQATSFPDARLDVVLAAYPDDIEMTWLGLEVVTSRPNGSVIEMEVAQREDGVEVFPYQGFTPHRTPGLYD